MKEKSLKSKISRLQKELKDGQSNIKKITKALEKISPKQKQMFDRIFPDFPNIDLDQSPRALQMCEKVINSNPQVNQELLDLLGENAKEFFSIHKDAKKEILCDYSKEIKEFNEQKLKETIEQKKQEDLKKEFDEINQYPKISKQEQEDFQSFQNMKNAQEYYEDNGYDFFECGQGEYQNEAVEFCFVQDAFFKVDIVAEVLSSKQDVGDRLYWVESIESVSFTYYDFEQFKKERKQAKEKLIEKKKAELEALMKE